MRTRNWIATILFWAASLIAWILVSVIVGAAKGVSGKASGEWLVVVLGLFAIFTLPIAVIIDLSKRLKNRRNKSKELNNE